MRVWVIAGGRVPPAWEPAGDPVPGAARRVPFRVAGLGVRAPASGRKDGLDVPRPPPGAAGVAVMGPVRNQAGQGRARRARDVLSSRTADSSGAARRQAIRFPYAAGHRRQEAPDRAIQHRAATRFITRIYAGTGSQPRTIRSPWVSVIGGASLGKRVQGELSGRLTVGAQDVPSQSTRPGFSVLGDGWERAAILNPRALGRRAARGLRHAMQARMADDGRGPRASLRPGAEHAAVRGRGVRPRGGRAARAGAHRAAVWIGLR